MAADFKTFYSLGYSSGRAEDGRYHRIEVRLKDGKRLKVRHREGHRSKSTYTRMADGTSSALLYGFERNSLSVDLRVGEASPQGGGLFLVPIAVDIPIANLELVPQGEFHIGRVRVYFSALDDDERKADVQEVPAPAWKARSLIAGLTYLGPVLRAIERYRTRVAGLRRAECIPVPVAGMPTTLGWRRRAFDLSFWNETAIEKERCISALVDYLRPRQYAIVHDDGWQPWDFVVNQGVWARAEVKLLVQDHGERRRQLDVGVRVRRTRFARMVAGGLLLGAAFAALGGIGGVAAVLAGGLAFSEGVGVRQRHRLARVLHHATENAARELPLDPLRSPP